MRSIHAVNSPDDPATSDVENTKAPGAQVREAEDTLPTSIPEKVEMTGVEPAMYVCFSAEGAPSARWTNG